MINATTHNSPEITYENIDKAICLLKDSLNICDDTFRSALLTYGDYSVDTSWSWAISAHKAQFVNSVDQIRDRYLSTDKRLWENIFVPFMKDLYNSGKDARTFELSRISNYKLCDTTKNEIPTHQDVFYYKLIHDEQFFKTMKSKTYAYIEENGDMRYWLLSGSRGSQYDKEIDYSL